MKWRAYIEGDEIDLGILRSLFPSDRGLGDPAVATDEAGTYFQSAGLDAFDDVGNDALRVAEQVVREMNGAARALDSSFRPIRLVGRYSHGSNFHAVATSDTLTLRIHTEASGVVKDQDGAVVEPPDPVGPRLLALAATSAPVAEALALLGGAAPPGWYELYKLHEIVRHEADPVKSSWSSKADLTAFTASANRPDVSGEEARHARMPGGPPSRSMTLTEAQAYVTAVVFAWLGSLL